MEQLNQKSIIEFPCDFIIKVLGKNDEEFENTVLMIVRKHFPGFGNGKLQKRMSKNEHYLSLTINIHPETKDQLDALYIELNQSNKILMAL
jgi:putative lipoic acid-binding regulatory protein